jgi:hypothetical protein
LLLSEWFGWFASTGQGRTVLIALAAVGATMLLMLLWLVIALFFRQRFQFTLRSMFILSFAVAIVRGWLAFS